MARRSGEWWSWFEVDQKVNMKTQKSIKRRLPGGKGTDVARQRYELYRMANERIKEAYKAGFYIESVAICESIISDRLEARLQFLTRSTTRLSPVLSLGHILIAIKKSNLETEAELIAAYAAIAQWADDRNKVVHQFVKRTDADTAISGEERIALGIETARKGMDLMRKVATLVRRHNNWEAAD